MGITCRSERVGPQACILVPAKKRGGTRARFCVGVHWRGTSHTACAHVTVRLHVCFLGVYLCAPPLSAKATRAFLPSAAAFL